MRLVLAVEKETRHVARVDRLDQDVNAVRRRQIGGTVQVGHVGGAQRVRINALRHQPCHDMDARALQRLGIGDGLRQALTKLALAARDAGQPALTGVPVARRCVEQHLP